jgi:glycosyltransferase involved in cell wall biosynthesis
MARLDIVIPLFKSAGHLHLLIARLNEWVIFSGHEVRVIFVEDGSPDQTFFVLKSLLSEVKFSHKAIRLAANYGQMAATAKGLSYADAPIIATMDDDLQHDPFELDKMISHLEKFGLDLVYASFPKRKHSAFRRMGSRLLKLLLLEKNRDYTQATSFRLMKSGVAAIFKELKSPVRQIEPYFFHYSVRIGTCEVRHGKRVEGKSTYTGVKLVQMTFELILMQSSFPLKFITRFGILMSLTFFILGIVYIIRKMVYDVPLGYTSLIVSIFFSTGLIMLSLGIIGDYIRRIWLSQNNLDNLVVAEELG